MTSKEQISELKEKVQDLERIILVLQKRDVELSAGNSVLRIVMNECSGHCMCEVARKAFLNWKNG